MRKVVLFALAFLMLFATVAFGEMRPGIQQTDWSAPVLSRIAVHSLDVCLMVNLPYATVVEAMELNEWYAVTAETNLAPLIYESSFLRVAYRAGYVFPTAIRQGRAGLHRLLYLKLPMSSPP